MNEDVLWGRSFQCEYGRITANGVGWGSDSCPIPLHSRLKKGTTRLVLRSSQSEGGSLGEASLGTQLGNLKANPAPSSHSTSASSVSQPSRRALLVSPSTLFENAPA
jgi:hypothetical protein